MSPDSPLPFDSLSPADQRRAIATDILAQLDAKRMVAKTGVYLTFKGVLETARTKTLRQAVQTEEPCTACAIGSIMLAQLRVNGDCAVTDLISGEGNGWRVPTDRVFIMPWTPAYKNGGRTPNHYSTFTTRYFTVEQLTLIEIAFELGYGTFPCVSALADWREDGDRTIFDDEVQRSGVTIPIEQAEAACQFGMLNEQHPESRLRAIMASVAAHPEGLFEPPVSAGPIV